MGTFRKTKLSKCDFCQYYVGNQCTAKPDSHYCTEANNEYFYEVNREKQKRNNNDRDRRGR